MTATLSEYAKFLGHYTKVEIGDFSEILGHRVPRSMSKSTVIGRLTEYMSGYPLQWMQRLPERDLKLLRTLAYQAPGEHIVEEEAGYMSLVEIVGIVKSQAAEEEGMVEYWLPEEFFYIVRENIDQVFSEAEDHHYFEFEHMVLGILYLYGAVKFDDMIDILDDMVRKYMPEKIVDYCRYIGMCPILSVFRVVSHATGEYYIVCPELFDVESLEDCWGLFSDIRSRKSFSLEDILETGKGSPDCCYGLDTNVGKRFREMLLSIGYYPESVPLVAHDMWLAVQLPDERTLDDIYGPISDQMDMIMNEDEYNSCLQIVNEYVNSLPRWQLHGFSPEEKKYLTIDFNPADAAQFIPPEEEYGRWQMPRPSISDGYTDLIEKDEKISRLLGLMPGGFPFGMAIPHVAKDDPCPCGSGLTYGRCHGKIMN